MSQPDVIPTFLSTPLHKQGQELRSEQTVASHNLYLFLRLNNSKTFVELVRMPIWMAFSILVMPTSVSFNFVS